MQNVYKEWHDATNTRLNGAVARLQKLLVRRKQLGRALVLWDMRTAFVVANILLVISAVYCILTRSLYGCLAGVAYAVIHFTVVGIWLFVNRRQRHSLIVNLRRGKYGHAIMFENTAEWILLDGALKQLTGQSLVDCITAYGDLLRTPVRNYLNDTWLQRGVIRMGGPDVILLRESPTVLQQAATVTAWQIVKLVDQTETVDTANE